MPQRRGDSPIPSAPSITAPPPAWRPRRKKSFVATAVLAGLVGILVTFSGSLAGVASMKTFSEGSATSPPAALASTFGVSVLAAAEASLAAGGGPAGGVPLNCTNTVGSVSASCSSSPTAASPLKIVSFDIHPTPDALAYPNTYITTVTGGAPPYTYSYSGLPYPCTSANVSAFSCEAYYLGSYNVTVTVTDTVHDTASATSNVVVACTGCLGGLTYSSAINPSARTDAATAYDVKDGYVVTFGGWNGSTVFGDTWYFRADKWEPLDPINAPSPRYDASMAYDKADGVVFLFGGRNASTVDDDTWTFTNSTWTRLATPIAPSARYGAAFAWDAKDNYLVLFGGSNGISTLSDTWKFFGGNWSLLYPIPPTLDFATGAPHTPITTPTLPAGRVDAGITYDYRDGYVLMFGGLNQSGGPGQELNDTWAFEAGKWVDLTGPKSPPARSQAVFAYDPSLETSILFGGTNVTAARQFQDTWEISAGVWTELAVNVSPSPRQGAVGVWDGDDLKLLVFSGDEEGLPTNIPDTWLFVAGDWIVDGSAPLFSWPQPSARIGAALAFDAAAGYTIYFGGETRYGANGETWGYANEEWEQIFPAVTPSPRSFASMAYDVKDGYVVLFGGLSPSGTPLGDTWIFRAVHNPNLKIPIVGGNWTELAPTTAPGARYGAGMVYDTADGVVLLFGGIGPGGTDLGDTWTFTGGDWTEVSPSAAGVTPPGRAFMVLDNDTQDGYVVLFGGLAGSSLLSDTWTYRAGAWTNLVETEHPSVRWGAASVYDPVNRQVFLFGGCGQAISPVLLQCNDLLNDSWRFIAGKWTALSRDPSPFARAGAAVDFDGSISDVSVLISGGLLNRSGELLTTDRWQYAGVYTQWAEPLYPSARAGASSIWSLRDQRIVLFGGYGPLPGGGFGYLNDTWLWNKFVWNEAASPGATCKVCTPHHPSPRAWGAIAWDPISGQEIYFGGRNQTGYLGQTWAWEGGDTTGQWTELFPSVSPSARTNESMVWDENDNCVVLFGGQNASGALGDTWTFLGGQWTLRTPSTAPAARAGADLAFDSTSHSLILFGGWNPSTRVVYNDTWEYLDGVWTNITPSAGPSPRYGATMSDDPQDGAVMLFGGVTSSGVYLGDTWYFHNGRWTAVIEPAGDSPLPSAFGSMGNDESTGNVMFFGGYNGNYLGMFWCFF